MYQRYAIFTQPSQRTIPLHRQQIRPSLIIATNQRLLLLTQNHATTNTCANCGKGEESCDDLKACTVCKLVKTIAIEIVKLHMHRPQHKKACKKRAAELHDEQLFKDPSPPDFMKIIQVWLSIPAVGSVSAMVAFMP